MTRPFSILLPLALIGCLSGLACSVGIDDPLSRGCLTDEHCLEGRTCFEGTCYEPSELPAGQPDGGDGGDGGEGHVVSFASDVQPIFDAKCISCHGGTTPASFLELTSDVSWQELLGSGRGADSEACGSGAVRVTPGNIERSVLWDALANQSDCVEVCPPGGPGLKTTDPAEFAIIEQWILQGAKNN